MLALGGMTQPPGDHWIKCIATNSNIRGVAIQATELARDLARRHHLKGPGAQGMAEAAMGALMVASFCKQGERINLNIQGNGRFQQALVDAYPDGSARGYVVERSKPISMAASLEKPMGPWGDGVLSVLRTKHGEGKQPYIGTVPLVTGYLAKDLTFYWLQSEQIPSAVGLVVNWDSNEITGAGGFLVQALPGASAQEIQTIEQHIHEIQSLADHVARNGDPLALLSQIFQSTGFSIMERQPIRFECPCSWERVERALALVGVAELKAMLEQEGVAVVRCDFCAKEYSVDHEGLSRLIEAGTPTQN